MIEEGATATFTLPSALNDLAGEYHLRVADVLTGAAAEATVLLE